MFRLRDLSLFLIFSIWLSSFSLAISAEIENMVRGGDFESADLGEWSLWQGEGTVTKLIDRKTSALESRSSLFIEIVKNPKDVNPAQTNAPFLSQTNHRLEKGETYTFSAFIKAEEERSLNLLVQLDVAPWNRFFEKLAQVGTEWEEYWVTGIMPQDAEPVRLCFENVGSGVSYWLDNIMLYEGEYIPSEKEESKAVVPNGELLNVWAMVKARY